MPSPKSHNFAKIIGQDPALQQVLKTVRLIADTNATVLIGGETGTGKELIAEAIHLGSSRATHKMTTLNCGAIPENLIESEFFGYDRGAFTGAIKNFKGSFEMSDGGTIFLDEVNELPLGAQVKLLRVLQKGEFSPLGTHETRHSDVRIIAATNSDLKDLVAKGLFRQDLYYRLCIVNLHIPPLRSRKDDLPALCAWFLARFAREFGRPSLKLSREAETCLAAYAYPGNVRELENILQRAVLLCQDGQVTPNHLPAELVAWGAKKEMRRNPTYSEAKRQFERGYLEKVMLESGGVIRKAARRAGLDYKNFYVKLKSYRIDPKQFKHS